MLHRLILKVTKFQLPPPKSLSTVVKNYFFFGGGASWPPMSNRVKDIGIMPVDYFGKNLECLLHHQQQFISSKSTDLSKVMTSSSPSSFHILLGILQRTETRYKGHFFFECLKTGLHVVVTVVKHSCIYVPKTTGSIANSSL